MLGKLQKIWTIILLILGICILEDKYLNSSACIWHSRECSHPRASVAAGTLVPPALCHLLICVYYDHLHYLEKHLDSDISLAGFVMLHVFSWDAQLQYSGKVFWSFNNTKVECSHPSERVCLLLTGPKTECSNHMLEFCVCSQAFRLKDVKFSFLEIKTFFLYLTFSATVTASCTALERKDYSLTPFTHIVR